LYAYQHGGTKVKLVKELGDKDVHLQLVILVTILSFTNYISEPLVLFLRTSQPNEEDLKENEEAVFTADALLSDSN